MPSRLFFPLDAAADVSPTISGFAHIQGVHRKLLRSADGSTLTTLAYTPDAADHGVDGEAHHRRYVSESIPAQAFAAMAVKAQFQILEAHANNNQFLTIRISVWNLAGTSELGVLLATTRDASEPGTTLINRQFTATTSAYTLTEQGRLVVDVMLAGSPGGGGGVQGHNGSIRWGCSASSGDLPENDTETATTYRPWIEFADTIVFGAYLNLGAGSLALSGAAAALLSEAPFTDPFTRADNTSLGGNWVESEIVAASIEIVGNRVRLWERTAAGEERQGIALVNRDFFDDQYAKATFKVDSQTHTSTVVSLIVRGSGTQDNFTGYVMRNTNNGASTNYYIYKLVNTTIGNAPTQLGSALGQAAPTADEIFELRAVGNVIQLWRGAVKLIEATDASSPIASGRPGLGVGRFLSGSLDYYQEWDDFEGGAVVSGAYTLNLEPSSYAQSGLVAMPLRGGLLRADPSSYWLGRSRRFRTTADMKLENAATPSALNGLLTFTVVALIYPMGVGDGPGFPVIVNKLDSTGTSIYWRVKYDDEINFPKTFGLVLGFQTQVDEWLAPDDALSEGKWWHVGVTHDFTTLGNTPSFYVNGGSVAAQHGINGSGARRTDGTALTVGNTPDYTRSFDGRIAYVAIWNRILSADEMRLVYRHGPDAAASGLVGYWRTQGDSPEVDLVADTDLTVTLAERSDGVDGETKLMLGRPLVAAPESYALGGSDLTSLVGRVLGASPESYLLGGAPAELLSARTLVALLASYELTGAASTFVRGYAFVAALGEYALFPATLLDDFNRANSNVLGGSWVQSESSTPTFRIEGNQLRIYSASSGGVAGLARYNQVLGAAQFAQLRYKADGAPNDLVSNGPAVRISATSVFNNFTGYVAFANRNTARIELRKYVSQDITVPGAGTLLGFAAGNPAVDDVIRIEAVGSALVVRKNGAVIIEATDAAIASGYAGAASALFSTAGAEYNVWDEWRAGPLVPATLLRGLMLSASPESYALGGASSSLFIGYLLSAELASYALTGADANLIRTTERILEALAGSYGLTGADLNALRALIASALAGSYGLSGELASLLAGRLLSAELSSYLLDGASASALRGLLAQALAGSYALDGALATMLTDRFLRAELASYLLGGLDASFTLERALIAQPGSYALDGLALALLLGRVVIALPGSYLLSGVDAELITVGEFTLVLEAGSYAQAGAVAALLRDATLALGIESYALAGVVAELARGYQLSLEAGSYDELGADALIAAARALIAESGVLALTGSLASTGAGLLLQAAPGAYVAAGESALLALTRMLVAESSSYDIAGALAELIRTGAPVFELDAERGIYLVLGAGTSFAAPIIAAGRPIPGRRGGALPGRRGHQVPRRH